jgi:hypothetical protein
MWDEAHRMKPSLRQDALMQDIIHKDHYASVHADHSTRVRAIEDAAGGTIYP